MKSFDYTIKDKLGLHTRPASELVKEANNYKSDIIIRSGQKYADAGQLLEVIELEYVAGTMLNVQAEGPDEEKAIQKLKHFFERNL